MVHRTYLGLGPPDSAVKAFDALKPWVREMLGMQSECALMGPDDLAMGIALDGLRTAAYHFTRRPDFYSDVEAPPRRTNGNGRLSDRAEAIAAFDALRPYEHQLTQMKLKCRPFGRDYLALEIARLALETTTFHFIREGNFYGCRDGKPLG